MFSLKSATERLQGIRVGKKIVFCSGTFDLFHINHLTYLEKAKKQGDILIVGINCDKNVTKRKGLQRPIIPEDDRASIISSLSCVDFVFVKRCSFEKEYIISILKPDVIVFNNDEFRSDSHIKRCDYLMKIFPDINFVYVKIRTKKNNEWSTTKIIQKIRSA